MKAVVKLIAFTVSLDNEYSIERGLTLQSGSVLEQHHKVDISVDG